MACTKVLPIKYQIILIMAFEYQMIKSHFSRSLVKIDIDLDRNKKGEINLWQRRYWEHQIRDDKDLQAHIDYIHFNPVKHGHVENVTDWPYSSFHRYVRLGIYDDDWGHHVPKHVNGAFGE